MKKILVLGGVSYNTMVYFHQYSGLIQGTVQADSFYETLGSTGVAKAMACHALQLPVTLYGIIGADRYGDLIRSKFDTLQLPFYYDIDPEGTERHVNLMQHPEDRRTSVFLHAPSQDFAFDQEKLDALIANADTVFLNVAGYCKHFIPLLQKHTSKVWCDLHDYDGSSYYEEFIAIADCLFFSSERLENYKDYMHEFHTKGKQYVLCSHGKRGASGMDIEGNYSYVEGIPVQAIEDTNGAGDNFCIGVYYALEKGYTLVEATKIGTMMGRLAVMSKELVHPELSTTLVNTELQIHYGSSVSFLS